MEGPLMQSRRTAGLLILLSFTNFLSCAPRDSGNALLQPARFHLSATVRAIPRGGTSCDVIATGWYTSDTSSSLRLIVDGEQRDVKDSQQGTNEFQLTWPVAAIGQHAWRVELTDGSGNVQRSLEGDITCGR